MPALNDSVPESGLTVPDRRRRRVVFPAPFGPTRPTLPVFLMNQVRLLKTFWPPKARDMLSSWTSVPVLLNRTQPNALTGRGIPSRNFRCRGCARLGGPRYQALLERMAFPE